MAGRLAQNGGSRTATVDISAGAELSIVCIIVLCWGNQCGIVSITNVALVDGWRHNLILIFHTNIYFMWYTEYMNKLQLYDFFFFGFMICRLLVEVSHLLCSHKLRYVSHVKLCYVMLACCIYCRFCTVFSISLDDIMICICMWFSLCLPFT
jgi:hypothetical protein